MTVGPSQPWYEVAFGDHYPELYAHRDDREAQRCLDLLPRLAPLGGGPVLDLGCGQGRHLDHLRRGGRLAVGLDLSWPLLMRAREADPGQPLVRADMRRIPLGPQTCSAVLSLFTAFGYFGPVAEHTSMVREVARVLSPGGHWYLDFLDSEKVASELASGPASRIRRLDDLEVEETRHLAEQPRRVVKSVSVRPLPGREREAARTGVGREGLTYAENVTLFTLAELDDLASAAGMTRVAAAGDYDGGPLVPGSNDRWLLVYRRSDNEKENG